MKHLSVLQTFVPAVALHQIDLENGIILMVAMFDLLVVVIPFIEVVWMTEQYDCIVDLVHYLQVEDTNVVSRTIKEIRQTFLL